MTEAEFRAEYSPFADVGNYSSTTVTRWLTRADQQLSASVWDTNTREWAIGLYVAHHLTVMKTADLQAENGGLPVGTSGRVTNQSIGGVSVGLDMGSISQAAAGTYNATTYGTQFWELCNMAGAGGVFV